MSSLWVWHRAPNGQRVGHMRERRPRGHRRTDFSRRSWVLDVVHYGSAAEAAFEIDVCEGLDETDPIDRERAS